MKFAARVLLRAAAGDFFVSGTTILLSVLLFGGTTYAQDTPQTDPDGMSATDWSMSDLRTWASVASSRDALRLAPDLAILRPLRDFDLKYDDAPAEIIVSILMQLQHRADSAERLRHYLDGKYEAQGSPQLERVKSALMILTTAYLLADPDRQSDIARVYQEKRDQFLEDATCGVGQDPPDPLCGLLKANTAFSDEFTNEVSDFSTARRAKFLSMLQNESFDGSTDRLSHESFCDFETSGTSDADIDFDELFLECSARLSFRYEHIRRQVKVFLELVKDFTPAGIPECAIASDEPIVLVTSGCFDALRRSINAAESGSFTERSLDQVLIGIMQAGRSAGSQGRAEQRPGSWAKFLFDEIVCDRDLANEGGEAPCRTVAFSALLDVFENGGNQYFRSLVLDLPPVVLNDNESLVLFVSNNVDVESNGLIWTLNYCVGELENQAGCMPTGIYATATVADIVEVLNRWVVDNGPTTPILSIDIEGSIGRFIDANWLSRDTEQFVRFVSTAIANGNEVPAILRSALDTERSTLELQGNVIRFQAESPFSTDPIECETDLLAAVGGDGFGDIFDCVGHTLEAQIVKFAYSKIDEALGGSYEYLSDAKESIREPGWLRSHVRGNEVGYVVRPLDGVPIELQFDDGLQFRKLWFEDCGSVSSCSWLQDYALQRVANSIPGVCIAREAIEEQATRYLPLFLCGSGFEGNLGSVNFDFAGNQVVVRPAQQPIQLPALGAYTLTQVDVQSSRLMLDLTSSSESGAELPYLTIPSNLRLSFENGTIRTNAEFDASAFESQLNQSLDSVRSLVAVDRIILDNDSYSIEILDDQLVLLLSSQSVGYQQLSIDSGLPGALVELYLDAVMRKSSDVLERHCNQFVEKYSDLNAFGILVSIEVQEDGVPVQFSCGDLVAEGYPYAFSLSLVDGDAFVRLSDILLTESGFDFSDVVYSYNYPERVFAGVLTQLRELGVEYEMVGGVRLDSRSDHALTFSVPLQVDLLDTPIETSLQFSVGPDGVMLQGEPERVLLQAAVRGWASKLPLNRNISEIGTSVALQTVKVSPDGRAVVFDVTSATLNSVTFTGELSVFLDGKLGFDGGADLCESLRGQVEVLFSEIPLESWMSIGSLNVTEEGFSCDRKEMSWTVAMKVPTSLALVFGGMDEIPLGVLHGNIDGGVRFSAVEEAVLPLPDADAPPLAFTGNALSLGLDDLSNLKLRTVISVLRGKEVLSVRALAELKLSEEQAWISGPLRIANERDVAFVVGLLAVADGKPTLSVAMTSPMKGLGMSFSACLYTNPAQCQQIQERFPGQVALPEACRRALEAFPADALYGGCGNVQLFGFIKSDIALIGWVDRIEGEITADVKFADAVVKVISDPLLLDPIVEATGTVLNVVDVEMRLSRFGAGFVVSISDKLSAGFVIPDLRGITSDDLEKLIKKLLFPEIDLSEIVDAILSGNTSINPFSEFGPGRSSFRSTSHAGRISGLSGSQVPSQVDAGSESGVPTPAASETSEGEEDGPSLVRDDSAVGGSSEKTMVPNGDYSIKWSRSSTTSLWKAWARSAKNNSVTSLAITLDDEEYSELFNQNSSETFLVGENVYHSLGGEGYALSYLTNSSKGGSSLRLLFSEELGRSHTEVKVLNFGDPLFHEGLTQAELSGDEFVPVFRLISKLVSDSTFYEAAGILLSKRGAAIVRRPVADEAVERVSHWIVGASDRQISVVELKETVAINLQVEESCMYQALQNSSIGPFSQILARNGSSIVQDAAGILLVQNDSTVTAVRCEDGAVVLRANLTAGGTSLSPEQRKQIVAAAEEIAKDVDEGVTLEFSVGGSGPRGIVLRTDNASVGIAGIVLLRDESCSGGTLIKLGTLENLIRPLCTRYSCALNDSEMVDYLELGLEMIGEELQSSRSRSSRLPIPILARVCEAVF